MKLSLFQVAVFVPMLPLIATIVIGLLGTRYLKDTSHYPVIIAFFGSLICSMIVFIAVARVPLARQPELFTATYHIYSWFAPNTQWVFDVSFHIDPLTAIMLVTVCVVSLLVAIYSRDYMRKHGHPVDGYERYFAFISLFVFSMCTLILAGNFLLLYVGWELVGLCSYLLIGFYYSKPSAVAAAKKAFIVNRVGDLGFGLGILAIYYWIEPWVQAGQSPLDYAVVFGNIKYLTQTQCTVIALLLFCGAIGKSAQIPLYVWLPDAMEGPSPVSALIHAATMVTAGVYMVVRCGEIFIRSPLALHVVMAVGAATAFYAATIAIVQTDMKRILAYSTISQLGYMFMGIGALAADAGIFHLVTHAFFKALLFLAAGNVMHAMGGVIDLRRLSGLRRVLPWTYYTFMIGGLALAGVPFFSGFFSKDAIIYAAMQRHIVFGVVGLVTALLTALYTFRMIFIAFWGEIRIPVGVHPHELSGWMRWPLVVLAVGAVVAGYIGVSKNLESYGYFQKFLAPSVVPFSLQSAADHAIRSRDSAIIQMQPHTSMAISGIISIVGIVLAWYLYVYRKNFPAKMASKMPKLYHLLLNEYYVDEWNDSIVVTPLWKTGQSANRFDAVVIDGFLWLISVMLRTIGRLLRILQDGVIQSYGISMTASLVVIVLAVYLLR